MTSKIQLVKTLKEAKYSFDSVNSIWYYGKKPIDEEEVLVHLIHFAKSQNIHNAGEWANDALTKAKTTPEITAARFVKTSMVRNRNRRIAGKYLFEKWCISAGIEITCKLEDFMKRNSLLVARFYNEITAGYECCKKQARIAGRVMRSVFIGWELRDEDTDAIDAEVRNRILKPQTPQREANTEAMRRYREFMTKLFTSDP